MFGFLKRVNQRLKFIGNNIFINNENKNIGKAIEIKHVFEFSQPIPEIKIFENATQLRCYKFETLTSNYNLAGQFLHASVRILENSAVMIDGIISKSNKKFPKWTDDDYEAIRLQPFYLSNQSERNKQLIGKGLFERGLHFSGTITPTTVRNICICDSCNVSFTIQHIHAGFSEVQYFYSSDSNETLLVRYGEIENMPVQLQKEIDFTTLNNVEAQLQKPIKKTGSFKYYNSFKCPHCFADYIDFENNKEIRPNEYYGNTFINIKPIYFKGNFDNSPNT